MSASPETVAYSDGMLDVGDGHAIYWRAEGDPAAPAVLIVHGGPGGALNLRWGEFLPDWRKIYFDQRGCGRSEPFGSTAYNTTAHLVDDIERLRAHLGIDRWALFGGSWGTTLALAYGLAHPERCTGFLLRGVFLARREDLDWFLWDVRRVFPDAHAAFLDAIEKAAGRRPQSAAEAIALTGAPLAARDRAGVALAVAWNRFEATLSMVRRAPTDASAAKRPEAAQQSAQESEPSSEPSQAEIAASEKRAVAMALLERHYMAEVLPPEPLLDSIERIAHLPCHIVHGRYDMVCLPEQAFALQRRWPGAKLEIAEDAAHATFEPGIAAALHRAAAALRAAVTA
ncbi:alpha/beta fold hydrolase [Chitinasiproducens palmae]|uniref:Proline iminopeptidase n=1 Tax=Chitinasiproducens palmae TaxID=1770053 RepID=A0A1H2PQ13_9BURK|nr:alpha/beta fold hydrolase [Chitinasiproducens palmae]SDV48438.1 prolyl aminopeptidase Serine peptidase. MEROPS family S33 [Chitinasiproducens palmae]